MDAASCLAVQDETKLLGAILETLRRDLILSHGTAIEHLLALPAVQSDDPLEGAPFQLIPDRSK